METVAFMWAFAAGLGVVAWLRRGLEFRQGVAFAVNQFKSAILILAVDRKSTRLNSSHVSESRMPSSA